MEGFRAGLLAGLRAERKEKPLSAKQKKQLARLLRRQRESEGEY